MSPGATEMTRCPRFANSSPRTAFAVAEAISKPLRLTSVTINGYG